MNAPKPPPPSDARQDLGRSDPDRVAGLLAATQHGVITRDQLRESGLTDTMIALRLKRGSLFPVFGGVFAVGTPARGFLARAMAATLSLDDSVLAGGSGAHLLGFNRDAPARPHLLVERDGGVQRKGLVIHTARTLDRRDTTDVQGIRCLTGPRCLLERAAQLSPKRLAKELQAARAKGLAPDDNIRDVIARHPGRAGGPALAAALLGPFTRSELEERFRALLHLHRITPPDCNVPLLGFEADCVWEDRKLIVELDGKATHGITAQFARDAIKDERFRAAGYRVLRLTWWDVVRDPRRTMAML